MKDISGQRFGRLVAVRPTGNKIFSSLEWECKCDCGATHLTSVAYLLNGSTKSCGCLRAERMKTIGETYGAASGRKSEKDIRGQTFGRLTVIEKTEMRDGNNIIWKCQCSCGKTAYVSGYNLRKGYTKSCGCLRVEKGLANVPVLQEARLLIDGTDVRMLGEMKLRTDNKTGIRGVSWDKSRNRYRATINFKGKQYYLGQFSDLDEAKKVRKVAEDKIYGAFLEWYYGEFSGEEKYKDAL
jgi:hypothetical protein